MKRVINLAKAVWVKEMNFSCYSDGCFEYQFWNEPNVCGFQKYFNLSIIADDFFLPNESIDDLLDKKRIKYLQFSVRMFDLEKKTYEVLEEESFTKYNLN